MTQIYRRSFLGLTGAAIAVPVAAAPTSRLLDTMWTRFGDGTGPDSSPWAQFLSKHLDTTTEDGVNRVRYGAARSDRGLITEYLEAASSTDPTTLDREAAMAFWINLYNALTVDLVLQAWPVDTIKKVRGGIFNTGPWDVDAITINGHDLSLDDIEHGILRPVWRDPRIHYAVNCASIGCPNLADRPYKPQTLEADLDRRARDFVAHPRAFSAFKAGFVLSSIYDWFAEDFGGTEASVLAHIRQATSARTPEIRPSRNRRCVRRWQVAGLAATCSARSALLNRPSACKARRILRSVSSRDRVFA